jgi:hypothetical protein
MEFFGTELDIGLTGMKKGQALLSISIELWRGGRLGSGSLLGYRLGVR